MKKDYIPNPIDTSDIELPEELNPLLEAMAKKRPRSLNPNPHLSRLEIWPRM